MLEEKTSNAPPAGVLPTEGLGAEESARADLKTPSGLKWALATLPIVYLWLRLIDNLRLEWSTNPQYSYGWIVPFLCGGLLVRRWDAFSVDGRQRSGSPKHSSSNYRAVLLFMLLALLYLPIRLIEEATPEWRAIQWALGIEAVGLTLCAVFLGKGQGCFRQLAFPICFFFVAIPWPTMIEAPIIQSLTQANSATVVELLGWFGVPAVHHGNLIEVSNGTIGVDEACSGIRSLQASLMVSLFLGEFYKATGLCRFLMVLAGILLAMALNACRLLLLTMIVARKGVAEVAPYHDPAGIVTTVICTAGLWGLALAFRGSKPSITTGQLGEANQDAREKDRNPRFSFLWRLGFALLLWMFAVDAGTELWYRHVESHLARSPEWSLTFPMANSTFKGVPLSADARNLLHFDEGKQGAWTDPDGTQLEAFYFSWRPGRVAGYLAKRHTPEICLPATGWKMLSGPELKLMRIRGVVLPIRSYIFGAGTDVIYVFHCRWESGVAADAYVQDESSRFNLIRSVWRGRGNKGQKVLEIVVAGVKGPQEAAAALDRQLAKLVKVEKV